ncbi:hypothetical protein [Dactylosporangium sp. NPDC049140]|uniref:hypothetical protein n=1 Tax=Dactylosporangium sp. NPDC049140 TaxID=3155647 RepID=UPI0033EAE9DB
MNPLHRDLMHALDALGTTGAAVAVTLLRGRWTGLRHDGLRCPVSNYIVAVVPHAEVASVTRNRITVISTDGEMYEVPLPAGATQFVSEFDAGEYDDLAAILTDIDGEVIDDLER